MPEILKQETESDKISVLDTPVLLIIFNRPYTTRRVFEAIRLQKPKYLFIAADGPRNGNIGDIEKCRASRKVIQVDWECELRTLYRNENLGCGKGPVDAITWFFNQVEEGIILEDDSIPHPDFFNYCTELLALYKDVKEVKVIGSANFQEGKINGDKSYYFSMQNGCFCSWATWKRTWDDYDYYLKRTSIQTIKKSLKYYKVTIQEYVYWLDIFKHVKNGRYDDSCWDYQLMFSIWRSNGIGIVPNVNLATNIGFDENATHTIISDHPGANKSAQSILPLVHPTKIEIDRKADFFYHKFYYQPSPKGNHKLVSRIVVLNKLIKSLFNINISWVNHFSGCFKNSLKKIRLIRTEYKNELYWNKQGNLLRSMILKQYTQKLIEDISPEEKEIIEYLKVHKMSLLPYDFVNNYKKKSLILLHDSENELDYIYFENKRLYFRRDWSKTKIKQYYANLLAEQDINSPHRYLTDDFNLNLGSVVIDAGSAEGIFALMAIDNAKKIYIIEPDPLWIEALEATFEPWKEKVIIIGKFVSSETMNDSITFDGYFADIDVDFIKIDVEGCERDVIRGAKELLERNHPLKIVAATYHQHNDEIELYNSFRENGFNVSYTRGYVPFYYHTTFEQPYLRKCLIRAEKKLYLSNKLS